MTEPYPWSLQEVESLVAAGKLSQERMLSAVATSVESLEPTIRAWSFLALDSARERAAQLHDEAARSGPRSPLHGVPFGAKDIFDTAGIPIE